MTRRIPQVADGVLHVLEPSGGPEIAVDSPSWVAWLTDPATRSFSFRSPRGGFTARKELRARGSEYWVAYRKKGGKLSKSYLGKAEDATLERLEDIAAALAARNESKARLPLDETAEIAELVHTDVAATVGLTTTEDHVQERPRQSTSGDPLLLTKLSIPFVRSSLVSRLRLSEKLEEGLERKLTLLSAPAGFGKSTLLSSWIDEISGDRPVVWLSLDPGDNDPARFWRYFVTAVDQLQPGSGEVALALLSSPQAPPIEAILTT